MTKEEAITKLVRFNIPEGMVFNNEGCVDLPIPRLNDSTPVYPVFKNKGCIELPRLNEIGITKTKESKK